MCDTPPQWALDKVAKINGWRSWDVPISYGKDPTTEAMMHHARCLAKYEEPPVDPDVLRAREILAQAYEDDDSSMSALAAKQGKYDNYPIMNAVITALRENYYG